MSKRKGTFGVLKTAAVLHSRIINVDFFTAHKHTVHSCVSFVTYNHNCLCHSPLFVVQFFRF